MQKQPGEETMAASSWERRDVLKAAPTGAAAAILGVAMRDANGQQVKWCEGTEAPKLKAPPNSCDCHHHIYDARYPVDPKAVLRPGDAWSRITALFRSGSAPAAMSS